MKFYKITLVLLVLIVNSCTDDTEVKKEKVQFVISLSESTNDGGGRTTAGSEIPLGSSLRISIETAAGESVLSLEHIELLHVGDNVLTPPIELIPGSYRLTDFMIVTVDNEVLYATPRRGSPLEKFVALPLDVSFNVGSGALKKLNMEVIDVTEATPEDFGYLSFNLNVVHPLQVAVFLATTGGLQFTSAKLTIEQGEPILQTVNLGAKLNKIGFRYDPDQVYTLRITKPGYLAYTRDISYAELNEELDGGALNVVLQPGMTIVTPYYKIDTDLVFDMWGSGPLSFEIDWGDGTTESASGFQHRFAEGRRYTVRITGDLDQVYNLRGFYNDANFAELDLATLVNLREFELGLALTPKVLDFSMNTQLYSLELHECRGTEKIIAPSAYLDFVSVNGNFLGTQAISALIDQVYANAVTHEVYSGYFSLLYTTFPNSPEEETQIADPPTAQAMEKLRLLRDSFGWEIMPEVP